ncbi:4-hydroxy-tetrahydrodipicolinate synthase [Glycomyces sp. TRM65418]|uniref:4-hydroxy-tetrahydrodipicolinate synthase n=1 Tax=Glycomyces sp. TRM65418 TaxID=2867006 RepID=UPI001CE58032|nr:4-hydroxy-tetrahydrodipicolinate synthase [Glycomyces sp. TRM65418]MCC3762276.1 4-hydroxy-tetrahydrodipicolinate synthase [Glycomyces sp. TRM65418]QZD56332.1 4-hydroxy-tetrahydrodipicolinate synthase [Glycomyces sp. TRM65418]
MRNATRPFGRTLAAMITPFTPSGELDVPGTAALARHLVDEQGLDGLVVNGTTGESPTTTDAEKAQVIETVIEAVGDRAHVIAGASTYDTRHSVRLAQAAEKAGAHGLLLVTPYYNKPTQDGIAAHFTTIADAAELPVMLYDIPPRSVVGIAEATFDRLAQHPRIIAVKDATCDLAKAHRVRVATGLAFYCGVDELNLAAYATGQVGVVSVVAHLLGKQINAMFDAYDAGDTAQASAINDRILPAVTNLMTRGPGLAAVKAGLKGLGLPAGDPRLPILPGDQALTADIATALADLKEA